MNFDALDYLSQTAKFRVEKVYERDAWGKETDEEAGYEVTMPSTFTDNGDDEVYAFVDTYDKSIQYRVRGNSGSYDAYDAEIDIDALKELKGFCEMITRGGKNG